ncbi:MAG: SMP-30/gluconolactonase/LRE family protein [Proteobacteria bacterium]|nr:SMP-30/gluconolactonase/LRE family protein [Pseudomonadota bacterium]
MKHVFGKSIRGAVAIFFLCLLMGPLPAWAAGLQVVDSHYKPVVLVKDSPLPGCNGAVIGQDGALYIVHTATGATTRVDLKTMKASTFVQPYSGTFITDDITADDKGNLYITGTTPLIGEVYRIDKNGVKTVIASGLKAPNGIQYNKKTGRLFMTECFQGNRVFEVDPAGAKPPRLMIKENVIPVPEGFGFDMETNDLIVPDLGSGKILRIHPDTAEITTIAEKFVTPVALKVGPDNKAYIVELGTGNVWRMSLDGKQKDKLAQIAPGLDNLAITPAGKLYVTSYWDATVFEVSTDGSGKYKTLFPKGPNQPQGVVAMQGKVYLSDAIMVRIADKGKWVQTKLNAWAHHGMPLTLGLAKGPGGQLCWPDVINGAVAIGNPATGEFKPVAGGLNQPFGVIMVGDKLYVCEYGAGQVTEISLKDGAKKAVADGLEGPLALTMIGGMLYVAEPRAGRVSRVDPATGKKEVFVVGLAGRPGALADDGSGNLLILDGAAGRLLRVNPRNLAVSMVAVNLPVNYAVIGSYPPIEFPLPMDVDEKGNIYLTTSGRGLIQLKKAK